MLIAGSSVEEALFEEAAAAGPEFDFRNVKSAPKLWTESLRLYPPAWMQGRHVRTNQIVAEMNISQGSAVMVAHTRCIAMQNMGIVLGSFCRKGLMNARPTTPDAMCAFGGGHHICPASGLPIPILQLILADMIWRLRFTVHGIACKPRGLIGLRLHPGLWLKLRPRQ